MKSKIFKRPESVLVVVYTADGETLLLDRIGGNYSQSVTGALEWSSETPKEAAERELMEETGITAQSGWYDWKITWEYDILPERRYLYSSGTIKNREHFFKIWRCFLE